MKIDQHTTLDLSNDLCSKFLTYICCSRQSPDRRIGINLSHFQIYLSNPNLVFKQPSNAVKICTSHRIKGIARTLLRGTHHRGLYRMHARAFDRRCSSQEGAFTKDGASNEAQGVELSGDGGGGDCSLPGRLNFFCDPPRLDNHT